MTVLLMPMLPRGGRSISRGLAAGLGALAWLASSGPARAQELEPENGAAPPDEDATAACISAHVEGQRLDRAGALREAREALVRCSRPSCPSLLVQECAALLTEVDAAIPTVVFALSDAEGRDVADARVLEGGAVVAARLDGKAIALDPGEHTFRFERPGADPIAVTVVVREGDKGRRIAAVLPDPQASIPFGDGASIPPLTWAFGAVGAVGLGVFAGFGAAGLFARSDLEDRGCKPECPDSDVDSARNLFLVADVSLGVGLAALAAATIIYVVDASEPPAPARLGAWRFVPSGTGVTMAAEW